jgi:hypothetical protein
MEMQLLRRDLRARLRIASFQGLKARRNRPIP